MSRHEPMPPGVRTFDEWFDYCLRQRSLRRTMGAMRQERYQLRDLSPKEQSVFARLRGWLRSSVVRFYEWHRSLLRGAL